MSILSDPHFHNEDAAVARLEAIVWPDGPYCPRCGGFDRITPVKGGRPGLRRCGPCKREFTVTVGTVFERSHVPIHKWFQCAHLMASRKKGVSAHQIHRTLKIAYKTAWFMCHRIREAMRDGHFALPLGGDGKTVEFDETFVGGLEKNKHASKRKHLGTGEYVRGDAHTNTVEGYFSIFKRGIYGTYHHVSEKHLKRYLCEFDFRYNERSALGIEDAERTEKALSGIVGKRLLYRDSPVA